MRPQPAEHQVRHHAHDRMRREVSSKDCSLDFELILPTPRALLGGEGWYDWRCSNWGTKWGADLFDCEVSKQHLKYSFYTAWSPACGLIEVLGANYPSLTFDLNYDEPGCGFIGQMLIEEGKLVKNECRDFTEAEMDEMYGE